MLEANIKAQLEQYLQLLEDDIVLKLSVDTDDVSNKMEEFVNEIGSMSSKITVEKTSLERTPSFTVNLLAFHSVKNLHHLYWLYCKSVEERLKSTKVLLTKQKKSKASTTLKRT